MWSTRSLLGIILLLSTAFAAERSCVGRCGSFDPKSKCQCDSMCVYYTSCCPDFTTVCPKKVSRGDVFDELEEESIPTTLTPTVNTVAPSVKPSSAPPPTPTIDPKDHNNTDEAHCSGQPFDAFLQLKNGSIYAFRGNYVFELDEKAVLPGYPKPIEDLWGITGPINAAFTRINCQGKSYIFKGNLYWRFDGTVLDEGFPRNISEGFEGIPNDVDAAFAVPAPSHLKKEKAYFFKDNFYYQYEFKNQPSHEECVSMSKSSPSAIFGQYTDLFCDQTFEDLFETFFQSPFPSHRPVPRFISLDWRGVRVPINAAMAGQVHLSVKPSASTPLLGRKNSKRKQAGRRRGHRGRKPQKWFADLWLDEFDFDYDFGMDISDFTDQSPTPDQRTTPVQSVYFFKDDKYYRVNLRTKRLDNVTPPYPRSIAKYWLGCKDEGGSATGSRAEKK